MNNTLNTNPADTFVRPCSERFGVAPMSPFQGSGLSAAAADAYIGSATAQHGTTLVAARKDDGRVPEPRGRHR